MRRGKNREQIKRDEGLAEQGSTCDNNKTSEGVKEERRSMEEKYRRKVKIWTKKIKWER